MGRKIFSRNFVYVSAVIPQKNRFLVLKRGPKKQLYPNKWVFPGGKVEIGENVIEAVYREVKEEVNLELKDQLAFIRAYNFDVRKNSQSLGLVFCIPHLSGKVKLENDYEKYLWVTPQEFRKLDIIAGSENHIDNAAWVVRNHLFISRQKVQGVTNTD